MLAFDSASFVDLVLSSFVFELLIKRNFENDLSAMATVTGNVRNSNEAVTTSGNAEDIAAYSTVSKRASCWTVDNFTISDFSDATNVSN